MKEVIEKISSYHLFNYLLPGVLFALFAGKFLSLNFVQEDIILGVFLYYFIGLIISRFGSLIIEPILKKIRFLKFNDYDKFISASKADLQIGIFSEVNNMYRTFCSMFILLLLLKLYFYIQILYPYLQPWNLHILISLLLILFFYSYKKQTMYIFKRINLIK